MVNKSGKEKTNNAVDRIKNVLTVRYGMNLLTSILSNIFPEKPTKIEIRLTSINVVLL